MTLLRTIPEAARPFTPETLAERWTCSAEAIRQMCKRGELAHFRLGKLYRIPAVAVEEIECQTSQSDVSEVDTASPGMKRESDDAISLRHAPERKRRQKQ